MKATTIYTSAEKLREKINSICTTSDALIKALNAADYAQKLQAPPNIWQIYNIASTAENLREELQNLQDDAAEEMRREAARANNRATVYAAAMRILKDANAQQHRKSLHGAHRSEDGYIYICDLFRLLSLNASTAPELPERPETLPEYIDAGRLFQMNARNHSDPVILPEPSELRAFIKTEKARKKAIKDKTPPLYTVTTEAGAKIFFNASFLLDMLEALPSAKAYADDQKQIAPISSIVFTAENGRGLLLPVRPPKK